MQKLKNNGLNLSVQSTPIWCKRAYRLFVPVVDEIKEGAMDDKEDVD